MEEINSPCMGDAERIGYGLMGSKLYIGAVWIGRKPLFYGNAGACPVIRI